MASDNGLGGSTAAPGTEPQGAKINDGGEAFPVSFPGYYQTGMTLRDWFAGQAAGMVFLELHEQLRGSAGLEPGATVPKITATVAYEIADAMLAARGQS